MKHLATAFAIGFVFSLGSLVFLAFIFEMYTHHRWVRRDIIVASVVIGLAAFFVMLQR